MKINLTTLRTIIYDWASQLPYSIKVYLFGSQIKGNATESSDVDIAVEFLDQTDDGIRTLIWFDNHDNWETYLTNELGIQVDLELFDYRFPRLASYLSEKSIVLYP